MIGSPFVSAKSIVRREGTQIGSNLPPIRSGQEHYCVLVARRPIADLLDSVDRAFDDVSLGLIRACFRHAIHWISLRIKPRISPVLPGCA